MDSYQISKNIGEVVCSFDDILTSYRTKGAVPSQQLNELKDNLNRFFIDGKCKGVIFTNNDKMFFGMCVMPIIGTKDDDLRDILQSNEPFKINTYYLEIDSKLLGAELGLTHTEITAVALHEIGHLIGTAAPMEEVRKALDVYMMENEDNLNISKIEKCQELFLFAVKDAVRKVTSMFENKNKEEILADEFVIRCGYGNYLISAFRKIEKKAFILNKDISNKFVVFTWVLRLYGNLTDRRIAAIHTLKKVKKTTGSVLVGREIENVSNSLNKVSITEAKDTTSVNPRKSYQFKYDILRKYEDNYYEYALRLKSANVEEDALRLLREMNARISVIEEFLDEVDLQEGDRKRFTKLYNNYLELRDALGKKNIVKDRYIGLWVEYPELE